MAEITSLDEYREKIGRVIEGEQTNTTKHQRALISPNFMLNSTTLRFGWNSDLSLSLDAVSICLKIVEIVVTIPVHFWVVTTLSLKSCNITRDIRLSYVADQASMMAYGLMMGFLIEPYPIFPWPGYYCGGYLCDKLDDKLLSVLLGSTFISVVPFFCYILIRLHNKVVTGSETKFVISPSNQVYVMASICCLMLGCVTGFGNFAVSAKNSDKLRQVSDKAENKTKIYCFSASELAALAARGGKVIVIGPPGDAKNFRYAVAFLFFSGVLIIPLLLALTCHSLVIIWNRDKSYHLSQTTQRAQDRLALAFFLQMIAAVIFYALPMLAFMYLILLDTGSWTPNLLSIIRPTIIIALSLKPPVQSLIFLSKNPVLRKKAIDQMMMWFRGRKPKKSQVEMLSRKVSSHSKTSVAYI